MKQARVNKVKSNIQRIESALVEMRNWLESDERIEIPLPKGVITTLVVGESELNKRLRRERKLLKKLEEK